ncbi:hypothetical protein TNCV_1274041 [Trichonephila clavipes]|nr:hypothetical protein TNCV_1274041 [Trichonephila clavipes]
MRRRYYALHKKEERLPIRIGIQLHLDRVLLRDGLKEHHEKFLGLLKSKTERKKMLSGRSCRILQPYTDLEYGSRSYQGWLRSLCSRHHGRRLSIRPQNGTDCMSSCDGSLRDLYTNPLGESLS